MKSTQFITIAVLTVLAGLSPAVVQSHAEARVSNRQAEIAISGSPVVPTTEESGLEQDMPVQAEKKEYILPYPGILPDHPLYWLKGIRDRIYESLVTDATRKLELDIKQADKRLVMGVALSEKGKTKLLEETISKGTKYMDAAVSIYTKAKGTDKPIPGYLEERLKSSLGKHIEVVTGLYASNAGLKGSLDLLVELQGKVNGK